MDKIIYNQQSLSIRNKWVTDITSKNPRAELPVFFDNTEEWEDLVDRLYSAANRKEQIQLIVQCKTIGLFSKANELEASVGQLTEKESNLIYK